MDDATIEIVAALICDDAGRVLLVKANLYRADVTGDIVPSQEIDEAIWIDPASPPDILLAPLTRDYVLPLASPGRIAGNVR